MSIPPVTPPLTTQGRFIIDATGRRVKLAGFNWTGAHQDHKVPVGLGLRHRDEYAAQLAGWGFNAVRLTLASRTVLDTSPVLPGLVAANPDLKGGTGWQAYQAVARALTARGIIVMPNLHLLWPGWCCGDEDGNGLWWNEARPKAEFDAAWRAIATAFRADPLVCLYDLKNEPRAATISGTVRTPTWDDHPDTGFWGMYTRTGNMIHGIDPDPIIVCEGLSYAGNLRAVGARPVVLARPGKVAYQVHDYPWFANHPAGQTAQAYAAQMRDVAGYLLDAGYPLMLGEFDISNASRSALGLAQPGSASPRQPAQVVTWWGNIRAWLADTDLDWFYWSMGPVQAQATVPRTNVLRYIDGDRPDAALLATSGVGPASPDLLAQLQQLTPARLGPAG